MFPQVWLVCHNGYKIQRQWNGVFLWITLNFVYQQGSGEHVAVNIIITISTNQQLANQERFFGDALDKSLSLNRKAHLVWCNNTIQQ